MIMGVTQAEFLPRVIGFQLGNPWIWIIALAAGAGAGLLIGAFQGFLIAYLEVPAFIVTLGGLLVWRGAAWWVTSGQTVAPMDTTFQLMGGGPRRLDRRDRQLDRRRRRLRGGRRHAAQRRSQRKRFSFPLRPVWAETLLGVVACAAILGAVWIANSYPWPIGIVRQYAQAERHRHSRKAGCSSPMASPSRC